MLINVGGGVNNFDRAQNFQKVLFVISVDTLFLQTFPEMVFFQKYKQLSRLYLHTDNSIASKHYGITS